MLDMHSKYDNMNTNGIFNALICINNHVNSCIKCMLSTTQGLKKFSVEFYIGEKSLDYNSKELFTPLMEENLFY